MTTTSQPYRRGAALRAAMAAGVVGGCDDGDDGQSTAMFMDLDLLHDTLVALQTSSFPPGTLHTFAVKANPVGRLLQLMARHGMGAEVASYGELRQALACGFPPDRVVFDSPIKTEGELIFALRAGVRINLDNLQEADRLAKLFDQHPELVISSDTATGTASSGSSGRGSAQRIIGIRINPQVGEGRIAALSTAGRVSKFGVPLTEVRAQVVDAFVRHPWLNALHLHVGSQGVPLELTVEGVAAVAALLAELTADPRVGPARLVALDIGGGLPVQYDSDDLMWLLGEQQLAVDGTGAAARTGEAGRDRLSQGHGLSIFERYARMLRERVPQLFESSEGVLGSGQGQQKQQHPRVQLMTEFGRCVVAKAAFAAGRVQYTKWCGGRHVVVSGLGGDLLLRAVYLPDTWPVRVELCSALGEPMAAAAAPAASLPAAPAAAAAATDGPSSAQNQQQGRGCSGGDGEGGEQGCGEAGPRGGAVVPTGGVVGGPQAVPTDVVGPLCFQGDRLAEAAPLPAAQPGDWVVVPDVGAYTLSMFCRYNSRCSPPVWGFRSARADGSVGCAMGGAATGEGPRQRLELPAEWDIRRGTVGRGGEAGEQGKAETKAGCEGELEFVLLRRGETVEEVLGFWNAV